jgi:hypothetical protein
VRADATTVRTGEPAVRPGVGGPVAEMNLRENKNVTLTSYTPRSLDVEIEHLERVLAGAAADSLFGRTYWRTRVVNASTAPGLVPRQRERLARLLSRLTDDAHSVD